jgi:hypothetical protein
MSKRFAEILVAYNVSSVDTKLNPSSSEIPMGLSFFYWDE